MLDGKLIKQFREWRGKRQGYVQADNPCLDAVSRADLGFHIGPFCIGATCCANDTYVPSDNPSGPQSFVDIVGHYTRRYRVIFNTDKDCCHRLQARYAWFSFQILGKAMMRGRLGHDGGDHPHH